VSDNGNELVEMSIGAEDFAFAIANFTQIESIVALVLKQAFGIETL